MNMNRTMNMWMQTTMKIKVIQNTTMTTNAIVIFEPERIGKSKCCAFKKPEHCGEDIGVVKYLCKQSAITY